MNEDPPPLRQQVPDVSAELAGLAARMINRYAPERPDWDEILRVLRREPAQVRTEAVKPAKPARTFPVFRLLTLFLLGLILSGMVGYSIAGWREETVPQVSAEDRTALAFRLAEQGKAEELRTLLIESGIPINTENDRGNTLLMQAAFFDRAEVVRMLLNDFEPNLNHRNKLGETVHDLARDLPKIRKLLQRPEKY